MRTWAALSAVALALGGAPELGAPIERRDVGDWRPGVGRAIKYAERREGSVTFAVVAPSGKRYRYHARTKVPAASVIKVMVMTAYLRHRTVRNRPLWRADKDLLRPMIRRSDNTTATTIADRLGAKPMNRLARRAGMKDFSYTRPWGLSTTSARDQARFMNLLERYLPKRHEEHARWLLSHIIKPQRWGVAKVAPSGWRLFFKSGWGSGTGRVGHQVAFLERNDRRVALAITTEQQSQPRVLEENAPRRGAATPTRAVKTVGARQRFPECAMTASTHIPVIRRPSLRSPPLG